MKPAAFCIPDIRILYSSKSHSPVCVFILVGSAMILALWLMDLEFTLPWS